MAVVIRMKRTGRRNRPCYRISVSDRRSPRDGKFLETIGLYDPVSPDPEAQVRLDLERARHWLEHGALPSETVASIFKRQGVYEGLPERKAPRKRRGRKGGSTRGRRVRAAKAERAAAKQARHTERVASKRAAAKAAAASGEGGEE